jgi:hypothetical protein
MPLLSRTAAMSARGFGMFGVKPRFPYTATYLVVAGGGGASGGGGGGGGAVVI